MKCAIYARLRTGYKERVGMKGRGVRRTERREVFSSLSRTEGRKESTRFAVNTFFVFFLLHHHLITIHYSTCRLTTSPYSQDRILLTLRNRSHSHANTMASATMTTTTTTTTEKPKVVIVGAGLGGLILGVLLERCDIPYTIVEKATVVKPLGE